VKPSQLRDSIEEGCRACAMLRTGIEHFETLDPDHTRLSFVRLLREKGDVEFGAYLDQGPALEFFPSRGKDDGATMVTLLMYISDVERFQNWDGSDSEASLLWVKEKIETCIRTHDRCKVAPVTKPQNGTTPHSATVQVFKHTLPTRLLDLRGLPEGVVTLLETDKSSTGSYVCLSHCWGKSKPLNTTRHNIRSFKDGIPWDSFPKTFQDAISFTLRLNITFLWIDCLCIIQDDEDNWAKEAAAMASVYRNSFITLAATASPGCDGGLLQDFQPTESYTLDGIDASDNKCNIYVRKKLLHWTGCTGTVQTTKFPLMTRAWVYQERLLSPRFLHFCRKELVWECNEQWACQCGSFKSDNNPKKAHSATLDPARSFQSHEVDGGTSQMNNSKSDVVKNWHHVVEEFSKLQLTYDRDRLPALAGLAGQNRRNFQQKYLAGIWGDNLPQDLLWSVKDGAKAKRPVQHSPPTWSWASSNGSVSFQNIGPDNFLLCRVIDAESVPANTSNPMGEVSAGRIVISGRLREARLHYPKEGATLSDREKNPPEYSRYNLSIDGQYYVFDADYDLAAQGPHRIKDGQRIYFIAILTDDSDVVLLVLTRISGEEQIFKRVGIMVHSLEPYKNAHFLLPQWEHAAATSDDTSDKIETDDFTALNITPTSSESCEQQPSYVVSFDRVAPEVVATCINSMDDTKVTVVKKQRGAWDTGFVLAKLPPTQASNTFVPGDIPLYIREIAATTPDEQVRGEWYLTDQMEERKRRGERCFKFFGQRVTIV
jgi:hypothetical protein